MRRLGIAIVLGGIGLATAGGVSSSHAVGYETRPYVVVGQGTFGSAEWLAAFQGSPGKKADAGIVCVTVVLRNGTTTESNECEKITASEPWIQASTSGRGKRERQIYVAVFSPETRKIKVSLGKGKSRSLSLRRLSDAKASHVGVLPVAYWTMPVLGSACLRRVVSFRGDGAVLSDSGHLPC
jgi:hypothetical protein